VPSTFLAELFPTRLRYSGLSLTYGLASALIGGTAPALATVLVRRTGDAEAIAASLRETPGLGRSSP
jgi:MFS transporter, MHS family, proline/betaine transporter